MYTIKCLFALTGTIRGTSKEKLHQGLSLESFHLRRWYRKLCLFYKIFKNISPGYLFNLIFCKKRTLFTQNLRDNGVRKNAPGKKAPRKNAPKKIAPRKNAPGKLPPRKIVSLDFCCF